MGRLRACSQIQKHCLNTTMHMPGPLQSDGEGLFPCSAAIWTHSAGAIGEEHLQLWCSSIEDPLTSTLPIVWKLCETELLSQAFRLSDCAFPASLMSFSYLLWDFFFVLSQCLPVGLPVFVLVLVCFIKKYELVFYAKNFIMALHLGLTTLRDRMNYNCGIQIYK